MAQRHQSIYYIIFCIYMRSQNPPKPLVINAQDQLTRKLSAINIYMKTCLAASWTDYPDNRLTQHQ